MMKFCNLCGEEVEEFIDGCHVKDRTSFSEVEQADNEDRHMNIIHLCRVHHDMFDRTKALGIADLGYDKQLVYVRWNCCNDGICIKEPVQPLRDLSLIQWGGTGNKIKPEYIKWKNNNLECTHVKDFCAIVPPRHESEKCQR